MKESKVPILYKIINIGGMIMKKNKKVLLLSVSILFIFLCGILITGCGAENETAKESEIVTVTSKEKNTKKEKKVEKEAVEEVLDEKSETAQVEEEKTSENEKSTDTKKTSSTKKENTSNSTKTNSLNNKKNSGSNNSTTNNNTSTNTSSSTNKNNVTDKKNNESNSSTTNNNTSSNSSSSTNKNNDENKNSTTNNNTSSNSHTHKWVAIKTTVHHDEEGHYENVCVKEAWTEEKPVYKTVAIEVCGNCGADCTSDPAGHIKEHMLNGTGKYGTRTEYVLRQTGTKIIEHPAEYEKRWVVDKAAWDETITTYKCSCGATK